MKNELTRSRVIKTAFLLFFLAIGFWSIQSTYAQVCGDTNIERTEYCDDGNTATGDGCDDNCQLEWFTNTVDRSQILSDLTGQYAVLPRGADKIKVGICVAYIRHMEHNWMEGLQITSDLINAGYFSVNHFPYPRYFQSISNMNIGNNSAAYQDLNMILSWNGDPMIMDTVGFRNTIYTRHPSMIGGTIAGMTAFGGITYDQGVNDLCAPYTAVCGNSLVEIGEQCDTTNLNGQTCASLGHVGGSLSCTASCGFNTSMCFTKIAKKIRKDKKR